MRYIPKHVTPRKIPNRIFIRFGIWSTRSTNWNTQEDEIGVSVYPGTLSNGIAALVCFDYDVPVHCIEGRMVFVVTGKVVGVGSDGEPLLQQVKALNFAIDLLSLPMGFSKGNDALCTALLGT